MRKEELARKLITSLVEADVTENALKEFVGWAKKYPFFGIAFDLPYLELARELLQGTETRLITVASYPLGGMTTETKIRQIEYAIEKRADEIDVSMNFNAIKSGDFTTVLEEVKRVVKAAGNSIEVLMIPQTHILTNEEKIKVLGVILEGGAKGIKLNSGFGWRTRPEDVLLVRREFGDKFRIDVSGGVRTTEQAEEYLRLGADYMHTSTPEQVLLKAE